MLDIPTDENTESDQHTSIFAEDAINALDVFGKACSDENLNTAIAIVKHPKTGKPVVFTIGHLYDVGVLLNYVNSGIRNELMSKLS